MPFSKMGYTKGVKKMSNCRNFCHFMKSEKQRYVEGNKRCNMCGIFIKTDKVRCECCGNVLSVKSRTVPYNRKYRMKLKMIEVKTKC